MKDHGGIIELDCGDDAGLDGPGDTSQFIASFPDPANDPGLDGEWTGLDTGDHPSGLDASGFSKSVTPSAGPKGGELDDGRAADDFSDIAKWSSFKNLSHSSFNNSSPRFPNILIASSGMCTTSAPV